MSVQPFLFKPTYPPGEEPVDSQEEDEEEEGELNENYSRIGLRAWCISGSCEAMSSADECFCCQELEELNQKFDESGLFPFKCVFPASILSTSLYLYFVLFWKVSIV